MKANTHPEYGNTQIRCACGAVIETRSTKPGVIQVEVCSSCHPFFTGKQRVMDTAGRIDRFTKKFGSKVVGTQAQPKKPAKPAPAPKAEKKSVKETLTEAAKSKEAEKKK